jgi:hypothetical protein
MMGISAHRSGQNLAIVLITPLLALWPTATRADLHFATLQVNVGDVRTGKPLAHRFAFINDGPGLVEITGLQPSCGCVTPLLPQRVYRSGEAGALRLEVHTLSQPAGPHRWTVQVNYRGGGAPGQVVLEMTARVVAEITVQPAALTIFADSAVGHDLILRDTRSRPFRVTALHTSVPALTARVTGTSRDASGHAISTVHLEMGNGFPEGRHEEEVVIATDDPAYRELRVLVTVVKGPRQRLAALPDRVYLTAAAGVPLPAQLVRLRDRDRQRVVIERIVADSPAVSCHWAAGPETMATLKITIDPKGLTNGQLESAIHVSIREPVRETVSIPILVNPP